MVTAKIGKNVYEIKDRLGETCSPVHVKDLKRYYGDQMEFYEDEEELANQEEFYPSTLNTTLNRTLNKTLKTKATKAKARGRSRKTRVLVKRKTVKRLQATKITKQTKINTNHTEASQIRDNKLISVITPELLALVDLKALKVR